jgi:hypothetical protein
VPGCGVIFKLTPAATAAWAESVLYAFNGVDGNGPESNLILGPAGDIYGVTENGGETSKCGGVGCGVVFRLRQW